MLIHLRGTGPSEKDGFSMGFVIGSGKAPVDWLFPRRADRGAANPGSNRPMFGSGLPPADRHLHQRLHAGLSRAAGKGSANHGPERFCW
jgi:hypothetical protein